ncbi:hypothetical protein ACQPYH_04180 [Kribbella sp. CA-245084]|uniref:hypothetical protein n=1 Tax=Kribbella sp. CA-245084 TaxID=3239940 RepID=UPI003D8E7506
MTGIVAAHIKAEARRLGVGNDTLKALTGTGAGGRVTVADVRAAAPRPQGPRATATVARPTPVPQPLHDPWGSPRTGTVVMVDAYSESPMLDYVMATSGPPGRGAPPPPDFFNSGPRPPITASGADPAILVNVHWRLRHSAALAGDLRSVLAMVETDPDLVGDNDPMQSPSGRGALFDYIARVRNWALWTPPNQMTEPEYVAMFGGEST